MQSRQDNEPVVLCVFTQRTADFLLESSADLVVSKSGGEHHGQDTGQDKEAKDTPANAALQG